MIKKISTILLSAGILSICLSLLPSKTYAFSLIDELILTNNSGSNQYCTADYSTNWYNNIVRTPSSQGNLSTYYPQQLDIFNNHIKSGLPYNNKFIVFKIYNDESRARIIVNYNNQDNYQLYLRKISNGVYGAQIWDTTTNSPADLASKTLPFDNRFKNWQNYDFIGLDIYSGINAPGSSHHDCNRNTNPIHLGGYGGQSLITSTNGYVLSVYDRVFLSNFKLKYDNDYDGPYPAEYYSPKPVLKPDFRYSLKNNLLSGKVFKGVNPDISYYDKMSVIYTLVRYDDQNQEVIVDTKTLKTDQEYTFNFDDAMPHTDYWLAVNFTRGDNPKDEYKFEEYSVKLDYIGASTDIVGVTDHVGGVFGESTQFKYEQCDPVDVTCHLRNFATKIREIFTGFFVPDFAIIRSDFDNLREFFATKLGFLATSVEMLVSSLKSFAAVSPVCSLSFSGSGGGLFPGGMDFNLCTLQQRFPQLLDFGFLLVRGTIACSLVFALYVRLKGVLKL